MPSPKTADRRVRLAVRETADGTEFLLDGRRVATLGAGGNTDHDVGLVALGTGTVHYGNYGFDAAGRIDGPAPGNAAPKAAAAKPSRAEPAGWGDAASRQRSGDADRLDR